MAEQSEEYGKRIWELEKWRSSVEHEIKYLADKDWVNDLISPIKDSIMRMENSVSSMNKSYESISNDLKGMYTTQNEMLKDKARQDLEKHQAEKKSIKDRAEAEVKAAEERAAKDRKDAEEKSFASRMNAWGEMAGKILIILALLGLILGGINYYVHHVEPAKDVSTVLRSGGE